MNAINELLIIITGPLTKYTTQGDWSQEGQREPRIAEVCQAVL